MNPSQKNFLVEIGLLLDSQNQSKYLNQLVVHIGNKKFEILNHDSTFMLKIQIPIYIYIVQIIKLI